MAVRFKDIFDKVNINLKKIVYFINVVKHFEKLVLVC